MSQGQAHMHTEYSGQRYPLFFAGGKACGHTEYSGRFCRKTISRLSSEAACILCFLPCFRQQAGREQRAARQPPLPCYLYFLFSFWTVFLLKSVSWIDTYLSARHTTQASFVLGILLRLSGHIWLSMTCPVSSSMSKYFFALLRAFSAWKNPWRRCSPLSSLCQSYR